MSPVLVELMLRIGIVLITQYGQHQKDKRGAAEAQGCQDKCQSVP